MVMPLGLGHLLGSADRPAVVRSRRPSGRYAERPRGRHASRGRVSRPGARCRIAHIELLRQAQGNAALLQVGGATAPRQGGLERGELLGEVRPPWSRLTGCWGLAEHVLAPPLAAWEAQGSGCLRLGMRCRRAGGLRKAAWRCCSSRHCVRAVSM